MTTLLIVEHHKGKMSSSMLPTATAASKLGSVTALVLGQNITDIALEAAGLAGVQKVVSSDNACFAEQAPENSAVAIADFVKQQSFSHVVCPATSFGKNLSPRIAALLDVEQISDVTAVLSENTFERPIYAGNAIATVESSDAIKVLTVRSTAFEKCEEQAAVTVEASDLSVENTSSKLVSEELSVSERPDLTAASVIFSGGRGLGDAEHFNLLYSIADKVGGAVGASRAAVDAGYVPNDLQVGQTGKIVAPDLYVAVGISGQIQHLAGMKESKIIVAINKDEDAPIFQIADYGLVADLFDVLPEMEKLL